MDTISPERRSENMRRIRGKDTKPELVVRRALFALGYRYRLHDAKLPGKPDLVFSKRRKVIFVHGCFWHRHENCRFCTTPASNTRFWKSKFGETVKRDKRNLEALRTLGWRVAIIWECSVAEQGAEAIAKKIAAWLQSGRSLKEISSRSATPGSRRISKKTNR